MFYYILVYFKAYFVWSYFST